MKSAIILIASLFQFSTGTISAQALSCIDLPVQESLWYKAYYTTGFVWIYGGDVSFTADRLNVSEPFTGYRFHSTGKTRKRYAWFYNIDDDYRTIFNCQDQVPVQFTQVTAEGRRKQHWEYLFHPSELSVTIIKPESGDSTILETTPLPVDLLTAVYICRFLPFDSVDDPYTFTIKTLLNDSLVYLPVTFLGHAGISIYNSGRMDTYHISARVPGGTLFRKDKDLHVYLTVDKERIPILVEAQVKIGWIRAVYQAARVPGIR